MGWYTICICYPIDLVDEGVGQDLEAEKRELVGGPLDGLVLDFSDDEDVWTIPGMLPGMVPGSPFSQGYDWGMHVYARRKYCREKMYHVGVTKPHKA